MFLLSYLYHMFSFLNENEGKDIVPRLRIILYVLDLYYKSLIYPNRASRAWKPSTLSIRDQPFSYLIVIHSLARLRAFMTSESLGL